MTKHVNLLVLGAGPGGYVAAIRAAQLGLTVAVVEHRWWGGVCLNVGCIPTKALLANAEVADLVTRRAAEFGITGDAQVDYATGWRRSRQVADAMASGVRFLMKKNQIDAVDGWGTFTGPNQLTVRHGDGSSTQWTFDHAIIATGAKPKVLPGVQLGGPVMTYQDLIMADTLPKSVVIAGSGAIGLEFATVLSSYGCQVSVVEYLDRLAPLEETAVSQELARAFRRRGIKSFTNTAVEGVERTDGGVTVRLASSGGRQLLPADALLLATGFEPNTTGFGLTSTGVQLDERGFIAVDQAMRTNVPHIHAVGDVTGQLMLAHVAQTQGVIAAEAIAGLPTSPLDYTQVPRATYCQPQIASLGLTTAQAEALGAPVKVSRFPFSANGKAQGLGEPSGFVLLVANADNGQLLGAHLIGHGVTELLPELSLAVTWGLTPDQIAGTVHAHPTLSEAIQQAAAGISGQAIDL